MIAFLSLEDERLAASNLVNYNNLFLDLVNTV